LIQRGALVWISLSVNGTVRQQDNTANLVFKPAETISELSTFANVCPGDVLLTGTPSGCALRVPSPPVRRLLQLLPERQFWRLFLASQRRRPEYLKQGDLISASIRDPDGTLDLVTQRITII
jgi:2-keto-4-pentenoate hydratase/2-oxohepta-3-ene-1,7-dioic acid hydratase in catechol pathway